MFGNNRYGKLDRSREVREAKKILPYTIQDIGDKVALEMWRANEALKQQEYEAWKALRRATVIKGMEDGTLAKKWENATESETTKAMRRYKESQQKRVIKITPVVRIKKSFFHQLYDFIMNLFLNVNYEPKGNTNENHSN